MKSGQVDPAAMAEDALQAAAGEGRRDAAQVEDSQARAPSTPRSQTCARPRSQLCRKLRRRRLTKQRPESLQSSESGRLVDR